jgi:hypothetical protein
MRNAILGGDQVHAADSEQPKEHKSGPRTSQVFELSREELAQQRIGDRTDSDISQLGEWMNSEEAKRWPAYCLDELGARIGVVRSKANRVVEGQSSADTAAGDGARAFK